MTLQTSNPAQNPPTQPEIVPQYMKMTSTEYIKGKGPIIHEHYVRADQQWLKITMDQQTKILKQMNFAIQFMAVIVLLGVLVTACSAVMGAGLLR